MNYFERDSCTGITGFAVDDHIFTEAHNNYFQL